MEAAQPARWGLPLAVLIVGMFMSVLDVTIVNVAVPSIQRDLGSTLDDVLWIATAYTLTLGVVVPLSSWLGDRFGLRNIYLLTLLGFSAGSALCGLAWNLDSLIAFRVLQAIPGGILPVITLTIVYLIVPREKIGAAMGMYGLGIVFAPAVGPVLGGYLIEHTDWRLIFYINVPIGLLGAVAAYFVLPRDGRRQRVPFDLPGFLAVAFGLFAILLASEEGQDWGWTSYPVLILYTAGALSLALFVVIELAVKHPLLDVRVFRHWQFTNSLILLSLLTVGLMSMLFFVPVFLQQGQGLTALEAGVRILPQALVVGLLMPIAGRLYDKIGPRWLASIGLTLCGYGTYLLCNINPDMTEGDVILWTCVRAAGMGLAMMPIMSGGIASLPMDKVNQGSAWNNVSRQVAGALGLAGLSAMASSQQAQILSDRSALLHADTLAGYGMQPPHPGGPAELLRPFYGLFRNTQLAALADSYSNIFLVTALLSVLGGLLALGLRSGPNPAATAPAEPARPKPEAEPEAAEPQTTESRPREMAGAH
ncbi:DHA2 family efflux MFS transporter permease subunit [Pseudonocardia eucalypti]|uniref:DHA2 family efflux MFS transporter permease subunit n=1 Tax=Pseudonocardia eucalypti TaxID=648755 RepID=A0ABP9QQB6_9PSEU|nr:EmrB/QacA subfamily drug resistance transporter [Pseudonocardia eucalypti]